MARAAPPAARLRIAVLWSATLAACGTVAAILLWPSPVDRPVYGDVLRTLAWLQERGLPGWVGYSTVEKLANVALFVVPGLFTSLLLPRRHWWLAFALCVSFSAAMELVQQLFLPERYGSGTDVVLNGTGALIGVGIGSAARAAAGALRTARSRS